MKTLGIVRGYRIGQEYLDFCYEARRARLGSGKLAFLEPLEMDIGGMDAMPDMRRELERLLRRVNLVRERGSLFTKLGMQMLAPISMPRKFYDHAVNAMGVWACRRDHEKGIDDLAFFEHWRRYHREQEGRF